MLRRHKSRAVPDRSISDGPHRLSSEQAGLGSLARLLPHQPHPVDPDCLDVVGITASCATHRYIRSVMFPLGTIANRLEPVELRLLSATRGHVGRLGDLHELIVEGRGRGWVRASPDCRGEHRCETGPTARGRRRAPATAPCGRDGTSSSSTQRHFRRNQMGHALDRASKDRKTRRLRREAAQTVPGPSTASCVSSRYARTCCRPDRSSRPETRR